MIKNLSTPSFDYPIFIGEHWLSSETKDCWRNFVASKKVMIVTNSVVGNLFLPELKKLLVSFEPSALEVFIVPDGERTKNMLQACEILEELFKHQFDRSSTLIALGGGVIGDLVGFVASIYQRGIPYIQVPTTLLAQVDSSVGGKTAVNFANTKNSVGTFCHPSAVFIGTHALNVLPKREYISGYAEIIKYTMIDSYPMFEKMHTMVDDILKRDDAALMHLISFSIDVKSKIVKEDECETAGVRQLLNFGHTFAHVIESLYGFQTYLHGEAVAIGMMKAVWISSKTQNTQISSVELASLSQLFQSIGLPVSLSDPMPNEKAHALLNLDKKVRGGKLNMILLKKIGEAYLTNSVDRSLIDQAISMVHYE